MFFTEKEKLIPDFTFPGNKERMGKSDILILLITVTKDTFTVRGSCVCI